MAQHHPNYISTADLARFLGISQVAVIKRIQKGKIKAFKIGRSYAIPRSYIEEFFPAFPLTKQEDKEYVSIMQAAKMLGVTRMAVYKKIRSGKLPAVRVGRHFVISKSDLEEREISVSKASLRDHVSIMELAEILGSNRKTIYKQVVQGKIKATRVGRHYVIAREDIPVGEDLGKAAQPAQEYMSVAEAARYLGISRIAVFKKIKKGQIPAERMGRSYSIPRSFFIEKTES